MSLSTQLLSGLFALREQSAVVSPSVGDEFVESLDAPAFVELGEDVDEVVARGDAEQSAGLNEGVGAREALGGFVGTGEEVGLAAHAGLAQCSLDEPVVDLEAPVGEATAHVWALLLGVGEGLAEGRARQTAPPEAGYRIAQKTLASQAQHWPFV